MEDRDGFIWFDGALTPWRDARLHVLAHTLHHGMGVFEGVRAYAGDKGSAVFRLGDHTRRFFQSAKILGMEIPFTPDQINAAHLEVMAANGLKECYFRPIAFFGGDKVGVSAVGNKVHVAIAAWTWDAYMGAEARDKGVRLRTSTFQRIHHNTLLGKAKASGHYLNSMLAHGEAKRDGYDDALMLDVSGCVAEASTSNIFVMRNGEVATPNRRAVLEGITRATAIHIIEELGLKVVERDITRDEIYCADEAFLTGTAAEITPVASLDGRLLERTPGPLTRQVQTHFHEIVRGARPAPDGWLTYA